LRAASEEADNGDPTGVMTQLGCKFKCRVYRRGEVCGCGKFCDEEAHLYYLRLAYLG
jgi:hypothetical protein